MNSQDCSGGPRESEFSSIFENFPLPFLSCVLGIEKWQSQTTPVQDSVPGTEGEGSTGKGGRDSLTMLMVRQPTPCICGSPESPTWDQNSRKKCIYTEHGKTFFLVITLYTV
jgi:hypothetical protein